MNDAAEEERLLRAMTRKPNQPATKVTSPRPDIPKIISPRNTEAPKVTSPRKEPSKNTYTEQLEMLYSKKSSVSASTYSIRRELDDVRAEIERLKIKEYELLSNLEKKEVVIKKLGEEIEVVEKASKVCTEEKKKDTEKKDVEAEELKRKSSNPLIPEPTQKVSENLYQGRVSSARLQSPRDVADDDLSPEEARLIRAMNRKSLVPGAPTKAQTVKLPEHKTPSQVHEPAWKEQERAREAERAARLADENKKKEEAKRAIDREAEAKRDEESRMVDFQNREGHLHTFTSPVIYDFDAEVKICGDFTDWHEVLLQTPLNDNCTLSITFPLSAGAHLYRFKVGGKWEVIKNQQTGVSPTGEVMNKVEV